MRQIREAAGLTLRELATRADVPWQTLQHYETAARKVPYDTLSRWAAALAVRVDLVFRPMEARVVDLDSMDPARQALGRDLLDALPDLDEAQVALLKAALKGMRR